MKNNICLLALCASVAIAVVGCKSSRTGRLGGVERSRHKRTTASIEVDLIGVATKDEENFLSGLSREDYWKT